MNHFIIDGNNLIGKIKFLKELQSKNKQGSREGLVNLLNNYFAGKKLKATLHFDGHPNSAINFSKGKIIYSENRISDHLIREEIDRSKNPKLITLISSDNSLINYARANSCSIIKSEDFYKEIKKISEKNEEAEKLKQLEKEKDLFIDLFTRKK
jgi:predicted RNA-binding protein with PIN domain